MAGKVRPIPDGYHTVTPYLIVAGAGNAIEFYKKVFDATEVMRFPSPGGKIGHAEIRIGDSTVMLADDNPDMGYKAPKAFGGSPISLLVYVPDVDKTVERAIASGAKLTRPVQDQFYGDRTGGIEDPFGHVWYVATHVEDVSPEEMQKRSEAMLAAAAK